MAYVDREKVLETARDGCHSDFGRSMADLTSLREVLEDTPTADVVEVKHGKWEKVRVVSEEYGYVQVYYQHKDCKISPTGRYETPFEYCPRCGAKMDGGKAE